VTVPVASSWLGLAPFRRVVQRVALVALGAALLLPACSVFVSQAQDAPALAPAALATAALHAQHHGGAATENDCASSGTVAAAKQPSATERGALSVPGPLDPPYPAAIGLAARPAIASYPLPFRVSFYLRSARILR